MRLEGARDQRHDHYESDLQQSAAKILDGKVARPEKEHGGGNHPVGEGGGEQAFKKKRWGTLEGQPVQLRTSQGHYETGHVVFELLAVGEHGGNFRKDVPHALQDHVNPDIEAEKENGSDQIESAQGHQVSGARNGKNGSVAEELHVRGAQEDDPGSGAGDCDHSEEFADVARNAVDLDELVVERNRVGHHRAKEIGAGELRGEQAGGGFETGSCQACFAKIGADKRRFPQICFDEAGSPEIRHQQVCALEICAKEV